MESLLPDPLKPYGPLLVGIAQALLIFLVGWIASKWANSLGLSVFRKRNIDEAVARFLAALLQYAVLAAAVVAALAAVDVETTSLVAILGSAALAIGLALQGSLSNFASGVMILLFRPFTIGDVVTAAGQTGKVDEIGLFATVLITPDNQKIIIPNAQATGGVIINLTVLGTRRVAVNVGVSYDANPEQVMKVLIETARSVDKVLEDPAPSCVLVDYAASSVNYTVYSWAKSADWWDVLTNTRVAVFNALNEAGIEIPFDQVVMHQVAE